MVHNLVSGLVGLLHDSSKSTSDLKIEYNHQLVDTFTGGIIEGSDYSALSGIKGAGSESAREKAQFKGHRKVVVVGAGVNGIQQATILLNDKRCTLAEIRIFESLEGYGGVWEKNKVSTLLLKHSVSITIEEIFAVVPGLRVGCVSYYCYQI